MSVEAELVAEHAAGSCGAAGGVAAEGELAGDKVAIEADASDGEEVGELVASVVEILLGVEELVEGRDWDWALVVNGGEGRWRWHVLPSRERKP